MSTRLAILVAALAVISLASVAPASGASRRYYLSLGDSLAQGMQPEPSGITVNTNQGYADQLYASERIRIPALRLVKLGCGGETTSSFLTGHGNSDAVLLGCNPAGGSQMSAAERFLRAHRHRGEVALVTIDIGANDVTGCISEVKIDVSCVTRGVENIDANLPRILRRLRRAAAAGVPMAAMTLYNPFLELYLAPGDQNESIALNRYARNLNEALARLYRAGHFRVAHVDTVFGTYNVSTTTNIAGHAQPVPVAVAEICRLTWMCAPPPVGPNIHANPAGYALIARAFSTAFGPLS